MSINLICHVDLVENAGCLLVHFKPHEHILCCEDPNNAMGALFSKHLRNHLNKSINSFSPKNVVKLGSNGDGENVIKFPCL